MSRADRRGARRMGGPAGGEGREGARVLRCCLGSDFPHCARSQWVGGPRTARPPGSLQPGAQGEHGKKDGLVDGLCPRARKNTELQPPLMGPSGDPGGGCVGAGWVTGCAWVGGCAGWRVADWRSRSRCLVGGVAGWVWVGGGRIVKKIPLPRQPLACLLDRCDGFCDCRRRTGASLGARRARCVVCGPACARSQS